MGKVYEIIRNARDTGGDEPKPYHAFPVGTKVRLIHERGSCGDFESLEPCVSLQTGIKFKPGLRQSLYLEDVREVDHDPQ